MFSTIEHDPQVLKDITNLIYGTTEVPSDLPEAYIAEAKEASKELAQALLLEDRKDILVRHMELAAKKCNIDYTAEMTAEFERVANRAMKAFGSNK
jgi:hypothetical protein